MREKLIGDRRFYRRLFAIAVPMMIQMAITNFASMLDNVMVGQMGTEQMTGVAIANQLVFVYNLVYVVYTFVAPLAVASLVALVVVALVLAPSSVVDYY